MCQIADWENYVVPQKNQSTGCIPAGFEFLLRTAGITDIDYESFQDEFDLLLRDSGSNDFNSISSAIQEKYPQVVFTIKAFESGTEKLDFIENCVRNNQPILISVTLESTGGWHIVPVVRIDEEYLHLLWSTSSNGEKRIKKISRDELVQRHNEWPGGNDVATLEKAKS